MAAVHDDGDVVALGLGELEEVAAQRHVGDVVLHRAIRTDDAAIARAYRLTASVVRRPGVVCGVARAVPRVVYHDGVATADRLIVDEALEDVGGNVAVRGLLVEEHVDVFLRDEQFFYKIVLNGPGVGNGRAKIVL